MNGSDGGLDIEYTGTDRTLFVDLISRCSEPKRDRRLVAWIQAIGPLAPEMRCRMKQPLVRGSIENTGPRRLDPPPLGDGVADVSQEDAARAFFARVHERRLEDESGNDARDGRLSELFASPHQEIMDRCSIPVSRTRDHSM